MMRNSLVLCLLALVTAASSVEAQPATANYADYVQEAAQKSGMPAVLIQAVMRAESAGNRRAVSARGAMGLMQLMPATWQAMRRQFDLGNDPFDPHDNLLAGAYYLRALYDTYGPNGFLAAYNAGPGRWEIHRDTGEPLPAETRAYVSAVVQKLNRADLNIMPPSAQKSRPSWMEATLFVPNGTTSDNRATLFVGGASPFVSLPVTTSGPAAKHDQ